MPPSRVGRGGSGQTRSGKSARPRQNETGRWSACCDALRNATSEARFGLEPQLNQEVKKLRPPGIFWFDTSENWD